MLRSRIGFEVELLAPRGSTRADLAHAVAVEVGGATALAFHRDSEPSAVPGMDTFRHLTRAIEVRDAAGAPVCSIVDDVTIVADLDVRAAPLPGWHRIVTDDPRLLNLMARVCDPSATLEDVLGPVAALFGTPVVHLDGAIRKVADRDGASVAMAVPLHGERHRPAEIVTPPLEEDHAEALERLLRPARALGFTVPAEAAVHLHFDAAPFRTPQAFANVITLFSRWRAALRLVLGTNPACRRLGRLPVDLVDLTDRLRGTDCWADAVDLLAAVGLTKYCDVNLVHVVQAPEHRDTLEVRVLPGSVSVAEIMERAAVVEDLLHRCLTDPRLPDPVGDAGEDAATLRRWTARGRTCRR